MDLNALEHFVTAAEAGSLSEAARRSGVPLPTLSRRVRKLEEALGVRLLERGTRGLALTQAGMQLLAESAPSLAALRQAEQRLADASGVAGLLRVSLPPHFEPMWSVLSDFGQRHPAVRFDVFVTDRRVDLVADGVDVALRVGEGGHRSYVGRTLTRYRHRVVAAPSLLERADLTRPDQVRGLPCACWRSAGPPTWRLGDVQLELEPVFVTNDYAHLLHLAVGGHVVTELPPFLAEAALRDGRLVEVLPEHPLPLCAIRMLVVDTRAPSPLVRRFLDFAAQEVPTVIDRLP